MKIKGKKATRGLALVLALLMCLNTMSLTAFAQPAGDADAQQTAADVVPADADAAVEDPVDGDEDAQSVLDDPGREPVVVREDSETEQIASSSLPAPETTSAADKVRVESPGVILDGAPEEPITVISEPEPEQSADDQGEDADEAVADDIQEDQAEGGVELVEPEAAAQADTPVAPVAGTLSVVYLDGEEGDDLNDGSNSSPVQSFATAKELVSDGGQIYIIGTVTVTEAESWADAEIWRATDDVLIHVSGGDLTLRNVRIDGREMATARHSLIFVENGTLTLTGGTQLYNNINNGTSIGGAIAAFKSSVTVTGAGTQVRDNVVTYLPINDREQIRVDNTVLNGGAGALGGGIYIRQGDLTVSDGAAISDNRAFGENVAGDSVRGGGIFAEGGDFVISDASIEGNSAVVESIGGTAEYIAYGGGIYADGINETIGGVTTDIPGSLTITNTQITNNTVSSVQGSTAFNATSHGGGVCAAPTLGELTIGGGTTITGNRALSADGSETGAGGGVITDAKVTNISDTTISGNTAAIAGGGLAVGSEQVEAATTLSIDGGTVIRANEATRGGGIYIGKMVSAAIWGSTDTTTGGTSIADNTARNGNGGGIFMGAENTLKVEGGAVISGNEAIQGQGGGIYAYDADMTGNTSITVTGRARLSANTSRMESETGGRGGGLYADGVEVWVTNAAVVSNNRVRKDDSVQGYGGGLYVINGDLTVDGSVEVTQNGAYTNNSGSMHGGGIYAANNTTTITGSARIHGNDTANNGFAIFFTGGTLQIRETVQIADNKGSGTGSIYASGSDTKVNLTGSASVSGSDASGIFTNGIEGLSLSGNASVTGSAGNGITMLNRGVLTLSGNAVVDHNGGVGIYASETSGSATANISGAVSVSNNAQGGISFRNGGTITIAGDTVIADNGSAALSGSTGGINMYAPVNSSITIGENAKITGNVSRGSGGAISLEGIRNTEETLAISGDVEISGNSAAYNGGAIYLTGNAAHTVNVTGSVDISGNTAGGDGGGIYIGANVAAASKVTLKGDSAGDAVTVTGNSAPDGDGGAIYTPALAMVETDHVVFADNLASVGYLWQIDESGPYREASQTHNKNILNTSYTEPYDNAYSNFDINFVADNDNFIHPEKAVETITRESDDEKEPKRASVGDTIRYKVTYYNYGGVNSDIEVVDLLPDDLIFVSAQAEHPNQGNSSSVEITTASPNNSGTDISLSYSNGSVTLRVDGVTGGAEGVLYVEAKVADSAVDYVDNVVHATLVGSGMTLTANTRTELTAPVKRVAADSDAGQNGAIVVPGSRITYEISYYNYKGDGANITITDKLDDNVTFVDAGGTYQRYDSTGNSTVSTREQNGTVTFSLYNLPAEYEGTVWLTVQVKDTDDLGDEVVNSAEVEVAYTAERDILPDTTNEVVNPILPGPIKDLGMDLGSLEYIEEGQLLLYTISYFNYQNVPLDITIRDTIPSGTVLNDVSSEPTSADIYLYMPGDVDGRPKGSVDLSQYENVVQVEWVFEDVGPDEWVYATLVVQVTDASVGIISNTATGQVGENGPELDSNSLDTPTAPAPEKSVDIDSEKGDDFALVGEKLIYTVEYENYTDDAADITIRDIIPYGTDYVDAYAYPYEDQNYDYQTPQTLDLLGYPTTANADVDEVVWVINDVPSGGRVRVVLEVVVNEDALVNYLVTNTATGIVNNVSISSNPVETGVIPRPEKKIESTDQDPGRDYLQVGDKITYEISHVNYTDGQETVVITDVIPAGTAYYDAWADGVYRDNCTITYDLDAQGNETGVIWTFTNVEPGGTVEAYLQVEVTEDAFEYDEITNTAIGKVGDNGPEVESYPVDTPIVPGPDKALTTDLENDYAHPGDKLTYTIKYYNYEAEPMNVTIRDEIPEGTVYVDAAVNLPEGGNYTIKTYSDDANLVETSDPASVRWVVWTLPDVKADGDVEVTLTVEVLEEALESGEVVNTARGKVGDNPEIGSNPVETEIIPRPEKDIDKVDPADDENRDYLLPGDEITYAISYYNYTGETASAVTIIDRIPDGTQYVTASANGDLLELLAEDKTTVLSNPNPEDVYYVRWTYYNLPAYAYNPDNPQVAETLTVVVLDEALQYNEVTNTATAIIGDNEVDSREVPMEVDDTPKKYVDTENGYDAAVIGEELYYTISYRNSTENAVDLRIQDFIPDGTTYVSADEPVDAGGNIRGTFSTSSTGGVISRIEWTVSNVQPGEQIIARFVVEVNEEAGDEVDNVATIFPGNNPSVETNHVYTPVDPGPVKTEITNAGAVTVGDELVYEISYRNYSTDPEKVTIRDVIPAGTTYVSVDSASEPYATYYPASGSQQAYVEWVYDEPNLIAPGETVTVQLTVVVTDEAMTLDEIENIYYGQVGDNGPWVEGEPVKTPFDPGPEKELTENTLGDYDVTAVGETLTYTITYRNYLDESARVSILDEIPEGTQFVDAAVVTGNGSYSLYSGGRLIDESNVSNYPLIDTVIWNFASVAAGDEVVVTLSLLVTDIPNSGMIENTASGRVNNNPYIDSEPVETPVIPGPEKKVDDNSVPKGYVQKGDQIEYVITYTNFSGGAADIIIRDEIPYGTTYVPNTASATPMANITLSATEIEWEFINVPNNTTVEARFAVLVGEEALEFSEVTNTAIGKVGNNPEVKSNPVETPTGPPPVKELYTRSGDNQDYAVVGEELTYRITYQNHTGETQNLTIYDEVPQGTSFISAAIIETGGGTGTAPIAPGTDGVVVWTISGVGAGETIEVELRVKVEESGVPRVVNSAEGQVGDGPRIESNEVPTDVAPGPEKSQTSPAGGTTVAQGGEITYAISYYNYTDGLADITITDKVPVGTAFDSAAITIGDEYRATADAIVHDSDTDTVTWKLINVPAGEPIEVSMTVTVTTAATTYTVTNVGEGTVGNGPTIETNEVETPVRNSSTPPPVGDDDDDDDDEEVRVTYHYNYEDAPNDGIYYVDYPIPVGGTTTRPEDPERPREALTAIYEFIDWYDNEECEGDPFDFDTPILEDTDLYAEWERVSSTAFDPVHRAYVIGYPGGNVQPKGYITRGELSTIFFRLLTDEDRELNWTQENPYVDVELNDWYNNAISTMTAMGILEGYPDDGSGPEFKPEEEITRGEAATAVVRFFTDYYLVDMEDYVYKGEDLFTDIADDWARYYINVAAEQGWIQGDSGLGGEFRPEESINRAEMVTLFNRVSERQPESIDDLLPDMVTWPDNMDTTEWYYLDIQEATNSHRHEMKEDGIHEYWTELLPNRDWSVLEKPDSRPEDVYVFDPVEDDE